MRTLRDFGTYEFICGQSGNNATKNIRLATIDCEGMLAVALAFGERRSTGIPLINGEREAVRFWNLSVFP